MKRVSGWVASAAAGLLAVPAMAGEDVDAKLAEMQELVQGLQQKVEAQDEQIEHQGKLLQDAQRVVRADEQGSLSGLATFLDSIEIDGAAIASYNINMNNGDNDASVNTGSPNNPGANSGQSGLFLPYHQDDNTFQVDQIWFGLGKPATEESRGGFRFDMFYGATASFYGTGIFDSNGDSSSRRMARDSTSDYVIDQAYVEYLAPIADINLKMGKFATPVGAEVVREWDNFNITRGIVYSMLQPVNHMGLIGTVPVGDMVELGAGIVNSGGSLISAPDDTYEKSYLATAKVGNDTANLRASFIYGSEPSISLANPVGDQVGLVDLTAWFNPADNLSLWANYDYLFNEGTGYYSNGIAVAGRLGIQDFGVALRGEYVQEHPSQNNGTMIIGGSETARIWSFTGTADYALTDHLTMKTELRYDRVNGYSTGGNCCEFGSGAGNYNDKDQYVWLIAAMYEF
jgi:hypothetical protein